MSRAARFWLALALLFSGVMILWQIWKVRNPRVPAKSEVLTATAEARDVGKDQDWIRDFSLTERSGRSFDSGREMPGHVWVTSVFFASCNSSCRQQNSIVQGLQRRFGEQDVRFLSITCDPQHDTPSQLRTYARQFDADPENWLFLTGDMHYIRRIAGERFEIAAQNDPELGPGHSDQFTVTDKWGNNRGRFLWRDPGQMNVLEELVRQLVDESEDPSKSSAGDGPATDGAPPAETPPEPSPYAPDGG